MVRKPAKTVKPPPVPNLRSRRKAQPVQDDDSEVSNGPVTIELPRTLRRQRSPALPKASGNGPAKVTGKAQRPAPKAKKVSDNPGAAEDVRESSAVDEGVERYS